MNFLKTALAALGTALLLSGCAADTSEEPMSRAIAMRYVPEGPSYVEIATMVNNSTNAGEHTGVFISGSQTILFDPAGTFRHKDMPRRQDVFYGVTPKLADYYKRYHARFDYRVVVQRVPVSLQEADQLIAIAEAHGATPKLFCSRTASNVLNDVPTFADVRVSFFPDNIMNTVAKIPGVETTVIREDDIGQNYVDAAES